jgi:Zn-dependent protease with chaperone function
MCCFKKVAIYDTLIAQMTLDEVIAVVNHELGHVHHNHRMIQFVGYSIYLVLLEAILTLGVIG